MRFFVGSLGVVLLFLSGLVAPATAETPGRVAQAATVNYSELRIGGRLVAYVAWSPSTNTFQVSDAYPDGQSAVVRYKLGAGTNVFTDWNSEGNGTNIDRIAPAGGLKIHFRACRADYSERNFRCARSWVTSSSSCLKHPGTAALQGKGVCVGVRGEVLRKGSPQNGWAFRLTGRVAAPGGKAGRIEIRTHRSGESWRSPTVLKRTDRLTSTYFDKVVHRGGYAFWIQRRLCSTSCTEWTGDMAVGIASARQR